MNSSYACNSEKPLTTSPTLPFPGTAFLMCLTRDASEALLSRFALAKVYDSLNLAASLVVNAKVAYMAHRGQAAELEGYKPDQATVRQNSASVKDPNILPGETKSWLKWNSADIKLGPVEKQRAAWV